jgi:hypothetical protein
MEKAAPPGDGIGCMLAATLDAVVQHDEPAKTAFIVQLGLRNAYRRLYDRGQARP